MKTKDEYLEEVKIERLDIIARLEIKGETYSAAISFPDLELFKENREFRLQELLKTVERTLLYNHTTYYQDSEEEHTHSCDLPTQSKQNSTI